MSGHWQFSTFNKRLLRNRLGLTEDNHILSSEIGFMGDYGFGLSLPDKQYILRAIAIAANFNILRAHE